MQKNQKNSGIDKALGLIGFRRPNSNGRTTARKSAPQTTDDIYAQISANIEKQANSGKKDSSKNGKKKKKKTASYIGRVILSLFLIGVIVVCVSIGAFTVYVMTSVDGTIDMDLNNLKLDYTSIIYAKDTKTGKDVELTRLHGEQNRIWVDFSQTPKNLSNAFVAVEDKRFFQHEGVDWKRTFSAFANMFVHIYSTNQGGSTITQQLIKNITKDDDPSAMRKIREIMRARYVEGKYAKQTILECYMNTIHLGEGVDGVEVASNYYFDKHVGDLNLTEMACLAALTKSPRGYDPYTNAEGNKDRRNFVLSEMKSQGYITDKQYKDAVAAPLKLRDKKATQTATPATVKKSVNSYFVDAVIEDVIQGLIDTKGYDYNYAQSMLYSGGYNIYTTLDTSVQSKLDKVFADNSNFMKMNSKTQPQSAITIMDYKGHIVGMVGGRGEKTGNRTLNRATQAKRQPGSSMKPIGAYAPALEFNMITYSSVVVDSPITAVINGKSKKWPNNFYSGYSGTTKVKTALERSMNTVPVKIVQELTPRKSYDFVTQKFGISTLVDSKRDSNGNVLSDVNLSALALGGCTYGLTTKEMTAAYATFGNLGTYWKPTTYTLVTDQKNDVVLQQEQKGKMAISEDTAFIMNMLLQNVVSGSQGTAHGAGFGSWPVFGKTGTTSDVKDRWFAGGTPYYVGACWFGYDQPKDMVMGSANPAMKVWRACMVAIHKDLKLKDFPKSDDVEYMRYCTASGEVATDRCSSTAVGWFKTSYEPTCHIHGGKALPALIKPKSGTASTATTTKNGTTSETKATTKSTGATIGNTTKESTMKPTAIYTVPITTKPATTVPSQ